METPKDINGVRTELIMQTINNEVYGGHMPIPVYNVHYEIVYKSLCKISKKNLLRCMQELDIGIIDRNQVAT